MTENNRKEMTWTKLWITVVGGGLATIATVFAIVRDQVAPVSEALSSFVDSQIRTNELTEQHIATIDDAFRRKIDDLIQQQRRTNDKLDTLNVNVERVRGETAKNGVRIEATNQKLQDVATRLRDIEKNGK